MAIKNRKQLSVLLLTALWVSVSVAGSFYFISLAPIYRQFDKFGERGMEEFLFRPETTLHLNMSGLILLGTVAALVTPLPGILFGFVLYCWFGREQNRALPK